MRVRRGQDLSFLECGVVARDKEWVLETVVCEFSLFQARAVLTS